MSKTWWGTQISILLSGSAQINEYQEGHEKMVTSVIKKSEKMTKENLEESYSLNVQRRSTDYKNFFQDSEN